MTTTALVPGSTLDYVEESAARDENPFDAMTTRLDRAAAELELDPGIYRILRQPERQITVAVPVQMDNGEIEVFTGHRVVHNTARGPGKGGIRFDAHVNLRGSTQGLFPPPARVLYFDGGRFPVAGSGAGNSLDRTLPKMSLAEISSRKSREP